jgi:hypothetical protein
MPSMQLSAAMWDFVVGLRPAGLIEILDHDRARRLPG